MPARPPPPLSRPGRASSRRDSSSRAAAAHGPLLRTTRARWALPAVSPRRRGVGARFVVVSLPSLSADPVIPSACAPATSRRRLASTVSSGLARAAAGASRRRGPAPQPTSLSLPICRVAASASARSSPAVPRSAVSPGRRSLRSSQPSCPRLRASRALPSPIASGPVVDAEYAAPRGIAPRLARPRRHPRPLASPPGACTRSIRGSPPHLPRAPPPSRGRPAATTRPSASVTFCSTRARS